MKNIITKAAKLTTIATLASTIILTTIYTCATQVSAKVVVNPHYTFIEATEAETVVSATVLETEAEVVTEAEAETETTEAETEVETTVAETETEATEAQTEAVTETEVETTVAETEVETTVEETTVAVTEAATEETTVAETQAETVAPVVASVSYTNVVFKDGYNTYKFDNLDQAKAQTAGIAKLTNEEANQRAVANKSNYAAEANDVLRLINEYRSANGLSEVAYDDTIATAAMHRAAESAYANWNMTAYENGSTKRHIRPTYEKASSIKDYYGLEGNFGENYGRFQANAREILDGWKNSSSHNALMLNGKYTRCGIGVAQDSEGYYYWIAIFM